MLLRVASSGKNEPPTVERTLPVHRFRTLSEGSNVGLSIDFFALSTTAYTHWHDFKDNLDMVQKAVMQVYHPSVATRIGLRFINQFTFGNTGVKSLMSSQSYSVTN